MSEVKSCEILIIGGGVMGCSIAYWLSLDASLRGRIAVVERDPTYKQASTALSAASIRMQFSNRVNVEISRFGVEFIRDFASLFRPEDGSRDLGFHENGYLFLAGTDAQADVLRENVAVQHAAGAETLLLSAEELELRFPYLNTSDVALAALGPTGEGWFDNMGLLNGFRDLARQNGVIFLKDEVVGLERNGPALLAAQLTSGARIEAAEFVNAAGPRARVLTSMTGVHLPVEPRKRTTFVFQTPEAPPANAPLMVDYTGYYVRPEGGFWMGATHPNPDPVVDVDDFDPRHEEFEEVIWPLLAERSQIFEALKVRRMWAGHYAYNTLDQNAIIGRHPEISNMVFANGFSGHGLQQAPAIGRGVSELLLTGGYQSLDLSPLGFDRVLSNQPFLERNIV